MDGDELVRDYLGRLEAASWPLPPDRRAELAGEVREHIETALAEAGRRDAVTVHNVLERLGRPEEIVATEVESEPAAPRWNDPARPGPTETASRWGPTEIAAILFLTVGAFVAPILGPVAGLVLVWVSKRWTRREKTIATAIAVVVVIVPILGVLSAGTLSQG
jgi:uncharacterized membrane protein